jgi:hypothetical protein
LLPASPPAPPAPPPPPVLSVGPSLSAAPPLLPELNVAVAEATSKPCDRCFVVGPKSLTVDEVPIPPLLVPWFAGEALKLPEPPPLAPPAPGPAEF